VCPLATPIDQVTITFHNKVQTLILFEVFMFSFNHYLSLCKLQPSIDVIMDLSNDKSNFGYEEINETIPVNSHVQEDFMTEDDGMYFSSFSYLKSDIIMIENLEDLKDPLLWETFDKDVGDFTLEDMKKVEIQNSEFMR